MKLLLLGFLAVGAFATPAFGLDFGDIVKGIEIARGGGDFDRGRPGDRWPGRPPRPPRYPDRGSLQCNARDKGYEEHWSGHFDCRECLERHDGCIETCEEVRTVYNCHFEGYDARSGRREPFSAYSDDRRQAEFEAENRCYRAGYRDCRYMGCQNRDERNVVSRRDCGRR